MRRTQVLVVELRPGAQPINVGQIVAEDLTGFDVQGWVTAAQAPVEEG